MDLFSDTVNEPSASGPRVFSVAEITRKIKFLIEESFPALMVQGEISNLSRPGSGHIYFTLKDEQAQIKCVVWRSQAETFLVELAEGMSVIVRGSLSLYDRGGYYQIVVQQVQPRGLGELQLAFERLKRKLFDEGLFDAGHKVPIPEYPDVVGVITSRTGAAIRDIVSVMRRRRPSLQVVLAPVRVQGDGAAAEIVAAIRDMDAWGGADVMIVGRGGGSLEDLQAFNDENVARAIHACKTPTVSAVGHEVDFTMADFVADVRAATPSAAAEMVAPDGTEIQQRLHGLRSALRQSVLTSLDSLRQNVHRLETHYALRQPENLVAEYRQRSDDLDRRLGQSAARLLRHRQERTTHLERHLMVLDPANTLKRGYAIVKSDSGVVQRAHQLSIGDRASVQFQDGHVPVEVVPS